MIKQVFYRAKSLHTVNYNTIIKTRQSPRLMLMMKIIQSLIILNPPHNSKKHAYLSIFDRDQRLPILKCSWMLASVFSAIPQALSMLKFMFLIANKLWQEPLIQTTEVFIKILKMAYIFIRIRKCLTLNKILKKPRSSQRKSLQKVYLKCLWLIVQVVISFL